MLMEPTPSVPTPSAEVPSETVEDVEAPPKKKIKLDFEGFFKEQDFPDLTIKFSGTEISAHRYLIGRKYSWFKKACSGQFKEAQDRVIELHEDDPSAVRAMLLFLYDKPYTDACEDTARDLLFFVRVFSIADKYDIDELKDAVSIDFQKVASGSWDDEEFSQVIREGYDLPESRDANSLRLPIETVCFQNMHALLGKPAFVDVCQLFPKLQLKMLQDSADKFKRLGIHKDAAEADKPDFVAFACSGCTALYGENWWSTHKTKVKSNKGYTNWTMDCVRCKKEIWDSEKAVRGQHAKYFYK